MGCFFTAVLAVQNLSANPPFESIIEIAVSDDPEVSAIHILADAGGREFPPQSFYKFDEEREKILKTFKVFFIMTDGTEREGIVEEYSIEMRDNWTKGFSFKIQNPEPNTLDRNLFELKVDFENTPAVELFDTGALLSQPLDQEAEKAGIDPDSVVHHTHKGKKYIYVLRSRLNRLTPQMTYYKPFIRSGDRKTCLSNLVFVGRPR